MFPNGSITLDGAGVDIDAMVVNIEGTTTTISSDTTTVINGALVSIGGTNCLPVARMGDAVAGGFAAQIIFGSPTVLAC